MPFTVLAFPPKIFLKMNSLFNVVNSFAYENESLFLEESPYFTGIWQQWFITIVKWPSSPLRLFLMLDLFVYQCLCGNQRKLVRVFPHFIMWVLRIELWSQTQQQVPLPVELSC